MTEWILTTRVRYWYALGQLAEGIKNEAYAIFLLFYYTTVVGLSGSLAGQAILIALLFDAVTDPLIGAYSDRLRTRWGRRHPLLLAASIPLPVFFYLSFAPPANSSQLQLFLWLTSMTVLTRGAMTLFHVPHLALGAEFSSDFEERSRIVTLQMLFSRIGAPEQPASSGSSSICAPRPSSPTAASMQPPIRISPSRCRSASSPRCSSPPG
ncbi:MAG: MFS transporter [Deltaproteobacteria bacterium]|nr:MFS transporter [Deltaproteobacteria bacterium]